MSFRVKYPENKAHTKGNFYLLSADRRHARTPHFKSNCNGLLNLSDTFTNTNILESKICHQDQKLQKV